MSPGIWNWLGWYVFGLPLGIGLTILWFKLKDKVTEKWFEWVLSALTILLLGFTMQSFWGSFAELEPQAAWMSLVFLGVPTIILAVVTTRLVQKRLPKAE